jgi:membrane dipeptidase
MHPILIDAHEDLAYNALTFGRDYRRSAMETRQLEAGGFAPEHNGQTLLGWPDFQKGQVGLIFNTLFIAPHASASDWETQVFHNPAQARHLWLGQIDYYKRLAGEHPNEFQRVLTRRDLDLVLSAWKSAPAVLPEGSSEDSDTQRVTHPVGLVTLMEGAEGLQEPAEMEEWYAEGVRLVGPVWFGNRYCGSNRIPGDFSREGYQLLDVLSSFGMGLDISHMNEKSALQALDRYQGPVVATHGVCRALLRQPDQERFFTDDTLRSLVEHDGVVGISPFSLWLRPGFSASDDPRLTNLDHVIAHIDHVCQLAGDARHVGLGTDFDGGWGWPLVPYEIQTIADLQKLAPRLAAVGYSDEDVNAVLSGNWQNRLQAILPE